MVWVEISLNGTMEQMPTDLLAIYNDWLATHPDRADRLSIITDNTIREFRDAIRSNHANIMDPRETYLPQSCVRHCYAIITHSIAMEMGVDMTTAGNSLRTSADVFLRNIPFGRWKTTTEDAPTGNPTPRFVIPQTPDYTQRILPILLAFFFSATAFAGWVKPGRTILDTQIYPTYVPSAYSSTTTTLYGHMQGIDQALAQRATIAQLDAAIGGIALTNATDALARDLAQTASISANAALSAIPSLLSRRSDGKISADFWFPPRIDFSSGGSLSLTNSSSGNFKQSAVHMSPYRTRFVDGLGNDWVSIWYDSINGPSTMTVGQGTHTPTPDYKFRVNGNTFMTGNLVVQGTLNAQSLETLDIAGPATVGSLTATGRVAGAEFYIAGVQLDRAGVNSARFKNPLISWGDISAYGDYLKAGDQDFGTGQGKLWLRDSANDGHGVMRFYDERVQLSWDGEATWHEVLTGNAVARRVSPPESINAAGQAGDYAVSATHLFFFVSELNQWGRVPLELQW